MSNMRQRTLRFLQFKLSTVAGEVIKFGDTAVNNALLLLTVKSEMIYGF